MPLQTHQLATAAAGVDEDVGHGLPLDGSILQRLEDICNLLRLEVVGFLLAYLGRRGLGRRVIGDQQLLVRLSQDHGDQPVMLQDRFLRQRLELILHAEQLAYGVTQELCQLLSIVILHRITLEDGVQGRMREAGLLRNLMLGPFQRGHLPLYHLLGSGNGPLVADTVFRQMLVKIIQVEGANVTHLQMPDAIKDPGQHGAIPLYGSR